MGLEESAHGHLRFLDHDALRVEHEHVHADPLAHHGEVKVPQAADGIGLRRDEDIPRFEDRRELIRIDVLRVDQDLAWSEGHERRVDVQRLRTATPDLVNRERRSEVPP
jgi:hypothetical protein